MDAVALATGKRPNFLLLIATLEVEGGAIGTAIHLTFAKLDDIVPFGDFFPNGLVRIQSITRLVNITKMHGLTQGYGPFIRLIMAGQHLE